MGRGVASLPLLIYPASPQALSEEDVAGLREGDCLHISSGMGGSFTMRFVCREGDRLRFENQTEGFEGFGDGSYTMDEVRTQLYDLVTDPAYRHEAEAITGKPYDEVCGDQVQRSRRSV